MAKNTTYIAIFSLFFIVLLFILINHSNNQEHFQCSGSEFYCKQINNKDHCMAYEACKWNESSGPRPQKPQPSSQPSPQKPQPSSQPSPQPSPQPSSQPSQSGEQSSGKCIKPPVDSIRTGQDTTSTNPVCKKYKNANANTDATVTWKEMAQAWKASGNNMKYCPEAIIMGGGECQGTADGKGCSIKGTGPSGIWQIDSARGGNLNLFNPCENAKAVYNQLVRSPDSYDKGCYTGNNGKVTAPLKITGAPPGGGVGGYDYKYHASSGENNCNWLGPFCHWQTNKNAGNTVSCCAFTGGANSYQPSGFPYYYHKKFLEYNHIDPPKCPGKCQALADKSYEVARNICKSV